MRAAQEMGPAVVALVHSTYSPVDEQYLKCNTIGLQNVLPWVTEQMIR